MSTGSGEKEIGKYQDRDFDDVRLSGNHPSRFASQLNKNEPTKVKDGGMQEEQVDDFNTAEKISRAQEHDVTEEEKLRRKYRDKLPHHTVAIEFSELSETLEPELQNTETAEARDRGLSKSQLSSPSSSSDSICYPPKFVKPYIHLPIGTILTLPPREALPIAENYDIQDGACGHPVVILGHSEQNHSNVYISTCTSFNGFTAEDVSFHKQRPEILDDHIKIDSGYPEQISRNGLFEKGLVCDPLNHIFEKPTWLNLNPIEVNRSKLATIGWLKHEIRQISNGKLIEVMERLEKCRGGNEQNEKVRAAILRGWRSANDKRREPQRWVEPEGRFSKPVNSFSTFYYKDPQARHRSVSLEEKNRSKIEKNNYRRSFSQSSNSKSFDHTALRSSHSWRKPSFKKTEKDEIGITEELDGTTQFTSQPSTVMYLPKERTNSNNWLEEEIEIEKSMPYIPPQKWGQYHQISSLNDTKENEMPGSHTQVSTISASPEVKELSLAVQVSDVLVSSKEIYIIPRKRLLPFSDTAFPSIYAPTPPPPPPLHFSFQPMASGPISPRTNNTPPLHQKHSIKPLISPIQSPSSPQMPSEVPIKVPSNGTPGSAPSKPSPNHSKPIKTRFEKDKIDWWLD